MKKISCWVSVLAMLTLASFSCTPIPPDLTFPETGSSGSASVEVNWSSETNVSLVFPSSGGTANVAIKATGNWEASVSGGSVDWCSFSPSSGASVDTQLKVSVTANESYMDRNCSITLICGENKRTVVVTQKQLDAVFLTPSKVEVPSEGGTFEVEVRHNTEFSYAVSKSATEWIIPVETKGMTTDKVHFKVLENIESEPRQGNISFISGTTGETVRVYQEGVAPCIVLTQKEFEVGSGGGSITVELKSNVDFECKITEGSSWISEDKTRSVVSTHTRSFLVAANPEEKPRAGKIVFSNRENGLVETVTITQKALIHFSLSPETVQLEQEGGEFEIKVTSTIGYKVTSMPDWIKEVSTRASVTTHTFIASANRVDESRSGVIVFCNDENVCVPVSVSQKPRNDGIDWNQEFYHRSLFMRLTATWCNWCPRMARGVYLAQSNYPEKIVHVALHGSNSDLIFPGTSSLESQYHTYYYPAGIVDGRVEVRSDVEETVSANAISAAKETESLYGTKTGIKISSVLSGRNLSVDMTVYAKKADSYKVTVLLLEDGIVGSQSGEQGLYVHNDIARVAVTNIRGEAFLISKDNSYKDLNYSVSIPEGYHLDRMKILVYVHAPFGSSAKVRTADYGDYYIDNCRVVPFGSSADVETVQSHSGGNEGVVPGHDIDM